MTMRLDLRKRPDPTQPGPAMLERTIYATRQYVCADCGRSWAESGGLVRHLCEMRGVDYHPRTGDGREDQA